MDVTRAKLNRRGWLQGIWQPALWSMHPPQQARATQQLFWGDFKHGLDSAYGRLRNPV